MRQITILLVATLLAVSTTSCLVISTDKAKTSYYTASEGGDSTVVRNMDVEDFSSVYIRGSANVTFRHQSGKPSITISAPAGAMDMLDISVNNGVLTVGFKKEAHNIRGTVEVTAYCETLSGANIYGSGDITCSSKVEARRVDYSIHGSGDIRCPAGIEAESVNFNIAGSGDISCNAGIKGQNVNFSIAGSGDISISEVATGDFSVQVSGSGDVGINSLSSSNVTLLLRGSGDIKLSGISCTKLDAQTYGSGDMSLSGKASEAFYISSGTGCISASKLSAQYVTATASGCGSVKCNASKTLKMSNSGMGKVSYTGNPRIL
ncbi:MAG: DUF2807 domain-containing protein [Prevotellaceae bacterium]|nr:DUF2807 domain-containing protein [Prevotellaceae bacterium]